MTSNRTLPKEQGRPALSLGERAEARRIVHDDLAGFFFGHTAGRALVGWRVSSAFAEGLGETGAFAAAGKSRRGFALGEGGR